MEIKDAYDLLTSAQEEEASLWGPFIRKKGVVLLMGSSDTGKSSWLRQFAYSIATGAEDFCGYPLKPTHKKAGYISTEDGDSDVAIALKKLHETSIGEQQLKGRLHFMFGFANQYTELKEFLRANPVDVLIVDCIADLVKGSMNDLTTVRQLMLPFKEIARVHSCAVIMMHHTVKNSESHDPDKRLVNGSQAVEAVPRCVLELRKDDSAINQRLLTAVKCNYLSGLLKNQSLVLEFDESKLSFSKIGIKQLRGGGEAARVKYANPAVKAKLVELKEQGNSFEKARVELVKEFKEEEVPKLTKLKELYIEGKNEGSRPSEAKKKEATDQNGPIAIVVE